MVKLQKSRYNRSETTFLSFSKNTVAPVDRFNLFWRRHQVSFQYNPVVCVANALLSVLNVGKDLITGAGPICLASLEHADTYMCLSTTISEGFPHGQYPVLPLPRHRVDFGSADGTISELYSRVHCAADEVANTLVLESAVRQGDEDTQHVSHRFLGREGEGAVIRCDGGPCVDDPIHWRSFATSACLRGCS